MVGILVITAVAVVGVFCAGAVFHKYVISDVDSLRRHVSLAESRIRADVEGLFNKLRSRV
jgi:hypothetical protein